MTPWTTPKAGTVVRDGAGRRVVNAEGRTVTKRGRSYTWLRCSVCGCGTWVAGLAPDQSQLDDPEYFKAHGRPCRGTPRCPGRHVISVEPT